MKKIMIFAIIPFLFVAVIYIAERSFFSNNVAGFAYSKLKPGVDLNNAIALINKGLDLKRNTWYDAADLRIQLENGALVNNKSDQYHMFCYSFFKDTSDPCKSACGCSFLRLFIYLRTPWSIGSAFLMFHSDYLKSAKLNCT